MSGGSNRTVTETRLSPEQREFVRAVMPQLLQFVREPPQLGEPVARGPSQLEQQALSLAPAAAGAQAAVAGSAGATLRELMGLAQRPVGGELEAVVAPFQRQLLETVLPRIRASAIGAGQFGSSRQALAQALATRETARAMGETALRAAAAERQQNLATALRAAALAPSAQAAFGQPLQTLLGAGAAERGLEEAQRAEAAQRFFYEQMAPVLAAQQAAQVVFGMPLAGQITTGPAARVNPVAGAMGGALFGYGLTQAIPSLSAFGPWGLLAGAAIGLGAALLD